MNAFKCCLVGSLFVAIVLTARGEDPKSFNDAQFIKKAYSGNMFETELGKLAMAKATNESTKKFGEKLATDHSKANIDLMNVAKAENVSLENKLLDDDQKEYERFRMIPSGEFDAAYIQLMVKGHEKNIEMYKKANETAKSDKLRDYAAKTLPVIKHHLEMAKNLENK